MAPTASPAEPTPTQAAPTTPTQTPTSSPAPTASPEATPTAQPSPTATASPAPQVPQQKEEPTFELKWDGQDATTIKGCEGVPRRRNGREALTLDHSSRVCPPRS